MKLLQNNVLGGNKLNCFKATQVLRGLTKILILGSEIAIFLHGSISCLGIYMSVIKPSMPFKTGYFSQVEEQVVYSKHINLTVYRKNACCLRLLVFLETWVVAPFWHWRSLVFPKGRCHHDLKAFCESGHNNLFKNIIENMK